MATLIGAFLINDTTDNATQKRTVWAMAFPMEERTPFDALNLSCKSGSPAWVLQYDSLSPPEWLTVTISAAGMPAPEPLIFQSNGDGYTYTFHGQAEELAAKLRQHPKVTLQAHSAFSSRTATFESEGIDVAWQRVADNCRANDG
jgi:hypothetical protein